MSKKRKIQSLAVVASLAALSGCASIIEGSSQQVMVNTNPAGADCALYREGIRIGTLQNTPGSVLISKTKHDVWIACVKQGFQQATYFDHSGAAGATVGNIILGGGIGWAIDSASGADNKYESPVNVTLLPDPAPGHEAPVLPATFTGTATTKP